MFLRPLLAFTAVLVAAAPLAVAPPARAADGDFRVWLDGVRRDATAAGIRPATVDAALGRAQLLPHLLELDRKQPERTQSFDQYIGRVVSGPRIEEARRRFAENRMLLERIGREYGVQPRFIVALWGIETDFGRQMGKTPTVSALATLAYDGRRAEFFRGELIDALRILDHDHIKPEAMIGSWAGAMGQSQFMPSSFLAFAVDYDHDGRRDIWGTRADVFASIANYLSQSGWHGDQTWGREIRLPARFDQGLLGLDTRRTLADWRQLGVRRSDGGELPARDIEASIVLGGKDHGPPQLVYDNFRTIMKWNRSYFFAGAVGRLADEIDGQ